MFIILMKSIIFIILLSSASSINITRLQLIPSIHAIYFASTKILSREFLDDVKIQSYSLLANTNKLHMINNHLFIHESFSVMCYLFFIGINNFYYNQNKIQKFQQIGYFKEGVNITRILFLTLFFILMRNVERVT